MTFVILSRKDRKVSDNKCRVYFVSSFSILLQINLSNGILSAGNIRGIHDWKQILIHSLNQWRKGISEAINLIKWNIKILFLSVCYVNFKCFVFRVGYKWVGYTKQFNIYFWCNNKAIELKSMTEKFLMKDKWYCKSLSTKFRPTRTFPLELNSRHNF